MLFDNDDGKQDWKKGRLSIHRYYAVNYPFYEMDPHVHMEWEIMYVVYGRCKVTCIREEKERDYDMREGEYIMIRGGIPHALHVERDCPCRVLNLEGRLEQQEEETYLKQLAAQESVRVFLKTAGETVQRKDDGSLHDILKAVIREEREGSADGGQRLMEDFLLGQMVLILSRQWAYGRRKQGGSLHCRKAQIYMEENFDQEITIGDIAEAAGISEGYLQRCYRQERGHTILEEILALRIEKAKMLLEYSNLPVVEVAVNAGFNSRQHFSASFRQLTGCTPMKWRKSKGNWKAQGV